MSSNDRRVWDPFAPPPTTTSASASAAEQPSPDSEPAPAGRAAEAAALLPDDLDDIKKADLIALAELADVPTYGTKDEIADRIREAAGG